MSVEPPWRQAVEEFKEGVRSLYGDRLHKVVLFGSHARGEAGEASDIDLLVVLEGEVNPVREIDRMGDLTWRIDRTYGVLLAVVPMARERFEHGTSPLLLNVRHEGVPA